MLLQRTRVLPNQRIDLPDYNRIEDFGCADFKAIFKNIWTNQNFVFSGFLSTGLGTNTLTVAVANSVAMVGQDDGVLFIGAPSLAPLTTTSLSPGTTNYVEVFVDQDTGGADSRAFWDQTAAGGQGAEFSQIVDTFIFLKATLSISTSNFSGDPDKTRICEVDVNGSGVITAIRDARNLYFRLGRGNNVNFNFPWASRTEPPATQFNGADKDLATFKQWADAVMTSIKEIRGSSYWYEASSASLIGIFKNASFSAVTPLTTGARFEWDGSNVSITDDALNPADADPVAALRIFDSSLNLRLTRQDDGKEVQKITFSAVPDAGAFTIQQGVDVSNSIPFNASPATVLAACNATWTNQLQSVTGSFESGFTLKFAVAGNVAQVTLPAHTLTDDSNPITITPATVRNGYSGAAVIPLAADEILWIEIPDPMAAVDYNGVGVIASNYRVSARGSIPLADTTYWLAYREGAKLIVRGVGELNPGQGSDIDGEVRFFDLQEDRSGYLRSNDVVTWTGTELQFTADLILELVHTVSGSVTRHRIPAASSPIALSDLESAWFRVDRTLADETPTLNKTGTTPLPALNESNKDVFVLFKRIDASGVQCLHIPFHKQVLEAGQTVRLGASGSGSGSGGDSLAGDYKRRLVLSPFDYVTPNIFETDKATKVDLASTGTFSPAKKAFALPTIGNTMVSIQMLDPEFLGQEVDVSEVELYLSWLEGEVDTAATYEVSRDGGTNYQAISMARVGLTNTYRGYKVFTDETPSNVQGYSVANADTNSVLNATTIQARAQSFTVAANTATKIKQVEVYLNKLGSPSGTWKVKVVRDAAGFPSTSPLDILSESALQNISALTAGNNTVLVNLPNVVLKAGTYHLVFETDAAYKSSFSAAVTELRVRTDTSSPTIPAASMYNGTVWSTSASTGITYQFKGNTLDLRVRVTSGTTDVYLSGYGLFYGVIPGVSALGIKQVERFYFTGAENRVSFTLSNFIPDPDLLEVHDPKRGQVYMAGEGAFRIDGQTIVFDPDTFNFPGENILLIFKQNEGGGFDNTDSNANAIASLQTDLADELASNKNYAQNAEMRFWQRQVPGTLTNRQDDQYNADRMYALTSGGAVNVQAARVADAPTLSPTKWCGQFRQADATPRQFGQAQILEGDRVRELRGKKVTLAFWARTDGTEIPNIRAGLIEWTGTEDAVTSDFVASWAATPTLVAGAAFANTPADLALTGSWQQFQITVTLGQTFTNLAWFIWTPAAEAQNDDFYVTQIQLVAGNKPRPWSGISLDMGHDEAEVSRFFQKSYDENTAPGTNVGVDAPGEHGYRGVAGSGLRMVYKLAPAMRAIPVIVPYDILGNFNRVTIDGTDNITPVFNGATGTKSFGLEASVGGGVLLRFHYTADAEL